MEDRTTHPIVARFVGLLAYETWATGRSIASLETVPLDRRSIPAYVRATQLMPHCALARMVWLLRIQAVAYDNPTDWFPSWPLDYVRAQHANLDAQWRTYMERLRDADLARTLAYTSSEGVAYTNTIEDVLTHVFNHSTYHRGQLARLVHESGGQRAGTDYIFYSRQARAAAQMHGPPL